MKAHIVVLFVIGAVGRGKRMQGVRFNRYDLQRGTVINSKLD